MQGAILKIFNNVLGERAMEFEGYLSMGRGPDNQLRLKSALASRNHAEIVWQEDGYWIHDLSSAQGTRVDDEAVTRQRLESGQIIKVPGMRLEFRLAAPALHGPVPNPLSKIAYTDEAPEKVSVGPLPPEKDETPAYYAGLSTEERAHMEHLRRRYRAIYLCNRLLSSDDPPAIVYSRILELIFEVVPADRGIILGTGAGGTDHVVLAHRARRPEDGEQRVEVSRTILQRARSTGVAVLTHDAQDDAAFDATRSVYEQQIRSAICAPMLEKGNEVVGFIYLYTQNLPRPFNREMLDLVIAVAGPAAIAIRNARYIEQLRGQKAELQRSQLAALNAVGEVVEANDSSAVGHAWRVSQVCLAVADMLGWSAEQQERLRVGALLHDVGKAGLKDGNPADEKQLSGQALRRFRQHPDIGARILKKVSSLTSAIPGVVSHHERWDGSGYPRGLSGEAIPVEGRLLAVADYFEKMTRKKPQHEQLGTEEAIQEICKGSGTLFDPEMVQGLEEVFRAGTLGRILDEADELNASHVICPSCLTSLGDRQELGGGDSLECPVCLTSVAFNAGGEDLT